jgi:ArsR family transcriptional regulator
MSGTITPLAPREVDIAVVLRVLADATRLRIYCFLRQGEACVCEVAAELALAENLVSHHLAVLRRAHLVLDRRDPLDARWVYYRIDREMLMALRPALGALFDPDALGQRTPICGPQHPIMPQRRTRPRPS